MEIKESLKEQVLVSPSWSYATFSSQEKKKCCNLNMETDCFGCVETNIFMQMLTIMILEWLDSRWRNSPIIMIWSGVSTDKVLV